MVGDLAGLGYDAAWESLRASDVGAPHRRERVFVLAWRPDAADTLRILRDRPRGARGRRHEPTDSRRTPDRSPWLEYAPAIHRWEEVTGREAPPPTETGQRGGDVLSPRFVEWLMGLPAGHVTDTPGLSRSQALKALGNGVVPQQAAHAVSHLAETALNHGLI